MNEFIKLAENRGKYSYFVLKIGRVPEIYRDTFCTKSVVATKNNAMFYLRKKYSYLTDRVLLRIVSGISCLFLAQFC